MRLQNLTPGMAIPFGGDRVALVPDDLARRFAPGDRLIVVQGDGALLHVPLAAHRLATLAVDRALAAFHRLARVQDEAIAQFFENFAAALASESAWAAVEAANAKDVADAMEAGKATGRLAVSADMRDDMIDGLRAFARLGPLRKRPLDRIVHDGWQIEQWRAPLGVVGFVFEGRPNVFADAAGVIASGNTAVFRIGADALATARALASHALRPALASAGLPEDCAVLLDSADRAAGLALFSDPRLALAVARGSGPAVAQLGAVARQSGVPVSLHGAGGAWLVAEESANADRFAAAVEASLDRKVCNTLNVCCIVANRAGDLTPRFLNALAAAGRRRGLGARLRVSPSDLALVGAAPPGVEVLGLGPEDLAKEWEWDQVPEAALRVVADLSEAIALFNAHSPRFVASLIAEDLAAHRRFFAEVEAPFVGDGFTRWVDGQYALGRPELGLSNWQNGRLFARDAILSGDGVFTVRTRMTQTLPTLSRESPAPLERPDPQA